MVLILPACANTPEEPTQESKADKFADMHPEERHIWHPPSEEELEARRQRQKWLDVIAADLERLFMGYADILGDEIILENLLRGKDTELQQLEVKAGQQKIQDVERARELNQALQELEGSVKDMDASLESVRKEQAAQAVKPTPKAQTDDYRLAILLFRNGQYLKSIAAFQRILGKEFPARLKDNILFGLASNYYKLKQYDTAIGFLGDIIQNHPKGDKWLVSHAMIGLIYNLQGNPDKAIPVLESALRHGPNDDLKKIINRLLKVAKGGAVDASS